MLHHLFIPFPIPPTCPASRHGQAGVLPGEASEEVGAQGAALHEGDRLAAVAVAGADAQQTVGGADEVVDLAWNWELSQIHDTCDIKRDPNIRVTSKSKFIEI